MRRQVLVATVVVGVCGSASAPPVRAQMLGVPVLQNAFSNPGWTVGANIGEGDDGSTYGAAAAWVPASGVVQMSGGIGLFDPDAGSRGATWGLRAMVPIRRLGTRRLGVAVFGGVGGFRASGATHTRIPFGVSVGYRRALRPGRGVSAYLAPFYGLSRLKADSLNVNHWQLRVAIGVDVAVTPALGVTVGYEGGSRARAGEPGPTGGLFGIGISYALHLSR